MSEEILTAVREFVESFEEVFGKDWAYSKSMLGIHDETPEQTSALAKLGLESSPTIAKAGTFIEPLVEDEIEDWGNRGALLERYRKLKRLL